MLNVNFAASDSFNIETVKYGRENIYNKYIYTYTYTWKRHIHKHTEFKQRESLDKWQKDIERGEMDAETVAEVR